MIQFDEHIFSNGLKLWTSTCRCWRSPPLHGGDLVLVNLHPPPEKSSWGVHSGLRRVDSVYQGSFGSPNHQFWDPMIPYGICKWDVLHLGKPYKFITTHHSWHSVDGSEIRWSPVEVGSSSHYLQGFCTIPGGRLGFLPSTVGRISRKKSTFQRAARYKKISPTDVYPGKSTWKRLVFTKDYILDKKF